MFGNEDLSSFYRTNFAMVQHHKYSLTEIEEMLPYEREIYISLLNAWIEEENERIKQKNK